MKQIKFRAWDRYVKKMSIIFKVGEYIPLGTRIDNIEDDKFIMQFTGLKDKNGKEIYEGDIVEYYFYGIEMKSIGEIKDIRDISWLIDNEHLKSVEVIGNIYENSELLK